MDIIRMRRKSISVSVDKNGEIVVKAPLFMPKATIEKFVLARSEQIEKMKKQVIERENKFAEAENEEFLASARVKLRERYNYFSELTSLNASSVKLTSAKGRFGSCSSKGNICYSKYLFLEDDGFIDYVILHEIAHLKFMNHSKEFYKFIENYMPDYKERIKKQKNNKT